MVDSYNASLPGSLADLPEATGYRELDDQERTLSAYALRINRDEILLWCRALRVCLDGLSGKRWVDLDIEKSSPEWYAAGLQLDLICLGISSSKSALDLLLTGSYSIAFAAIRHAIEITVQCIYLGAFPSEHRHWYNDPGDLQLSPKTPGCGRMVDQIKAFYAGTRDQEFIDFIDALYERWDLMSKGSHPTIDGVLQVQDSDDEGRGIIGAHYSEYHSLAGFEEGLFAVDCLISMIIALDSTNQELLVAHEALSGDIQEWRESRFPDSSA